MLSEFKAFLMKHNVVGLAVAVVIGGAVGKLVTALVSDIIMPIVGALTPEGNWREAVVPVGKIRFGIGDFLGAFVDFVIISAVIFLIVKNVLKEEAEKK
jgi:large conductance mechanosensitive channel